LYNAPRAATITATTNCICWKLDRDTFNHIVKDSAQKKRDKYETFLSTVEILSSMDTYERQKLTDAIKVESFMKGDFVITEGDSGDKFFIVSEGTTSARKLIGGQQKEVMTYDAGQYFGERALLMNEARAANIVVTSDKAVCLSLDRATFSRLLGPLDQILMRNMEKYAKFKA